MKSSRRLSMAIGLPLALLFGLAATAQETGLQFVQTDQGVTVLEGIRPVLTYQRAVKSKQGKWPRSNYVHPLYSLDGEVLTEDFPEDHGHHRGVFWAWHQVRVDGKPIGDAWLCEDFQWDVDELRAELSKSAPSESLQSDESLTIRAGVTWRSSQLLDAQNQPEAIARERVAITVHAEQDDYRAIDFEIGILALLDNVAIGGSEDQKGYGGFSPRLKLSDATRFIGPTGVVEPTTTAISGGPWMDIRGDEGSVAILSHRSNPGYPQPWILRQSRSMQNAVYPGRHPIDLSTTEELILRYRLVIHRGSLDGERMGRILSDFDAN